jgi:hypothetical protein
MKLFKLQMLKFSIVVWLAVVLALVSACGTQSTPTSVPTAAPAPTTTPELTLDSLLSSAGGELAALETAKFEMIDELESGQKFFGMKLKTVEGTIKSPDSFRMLVNVETPNFGFVVIEMMAVGQQAFMKFSADAPWAPLPLDQVPFNFGGMGVTLSELVTVLKDPSISGREEVGRGQTVRLDGSVISEEMGNLITSVDPGHPIKLTFWFDEADHRLRQFRIDGKLFNDDAPETSRLVKIMDVNAPVEIELPDTASGS